MTQKPLHWSKDYWHLSQCWGQPLWFSACSQTKGSDRHQNTQTSLKHIFTPFLTLQQHCPKKAHRLLCLPITYKFIPVKTTLW